MSLSLAHTFIFFLKFLHLCVCWCLDLTVFSSPSGNNVTLSLLIHLLCMLPDYWAILCLLTLIRVPLTYLVDTIYWASLKYDLWKLNSRIHFLWVKQSIIELNRDPENCKTHTFGLYSIIGRSENFIRKTWFWIQVLNMGRYFQIHLHIRQDVELLLAKS